MMSNTDNSEAGLTRPETLAGEMGRRISGFWPRILASAARRLAARGTTVSGLSNSLTAKLSVRSAAGSWRGNF